ncbi:MAG: heme o synthase [Salinigranum sp.]
MTRGLGGVAPNSRVPALLAASTVGVYLLILAGVTNVLAHAASACPAWPACGGLLFASRDPRLLVVLGHRLTALLVAGLLLVTAVAARRAGLERRVQAAVAASILLYPVEVWIGAATALSGGSTALSAVHLLVAMAIFTGLLLALLWQLESETPADDPPAAGASVDAPAPPVAGDAPVASAAGDAPVASAAGDATVISAAGDATLAPAEGAPAASSADDAPATSSAEDAPTAPAPAGIRARAWAYFQLTKPKLWWLLSLVAVAGMVLAAGGLPPIRTFLGTLAGGVLAIGASGTFNHVIERDVDRRMARTADRPVAKARIPPRRAVAFGVLLAVASVAVFLATTNVLSAVLGLVAILFYSVVYTVILKPNTTQNTVIGGAVGAFPALIGWAAVTNAVGVPAVVLGTVIFLWTPAHFYSLAIVLEEDYARGGFPMLPVVRGEAVTRRHILGYLGATMLGAVLLATTTALDWLYGAVAVSLGAVFLWAVLRLYRERTDRAAFRAFMASNAYLGLLLIAIVADTMLV